MRQITADHGRSRQITAVTAGLQLLAAYHVLLPTYVLPTTSYLPTTYLELLLREPTRLPLLLHLGAQQLHLVRVGLGLGVG
jgi:hypothetical protein